MVDTCPSLGFFMLCEAPGSLFHWALRLGPAEAYTSFGPQSPTLPPLTQDQGHIFILCFVAGPGKGLVLT